MVALQPSNDPRDKGLKTVVLVDMTLSVVSLEADSFPASDAVITTKMKSEMCIARTETKTARALIENHSMTRHNVAFGFTGLRLCRSLALP